MKHFIISILLSFFLFGFAPVKSNFSPNETFSQLETSEQAVWKIHNFNISGTGFFIGPNHFITNFHVIDMILHQMPFGDISQNDRSANKDSMSRIVLSQEGSTSVLRIKKILAISALYDLALLETEENVTDYLSLREHPLELSESLFLIAYPGGVFTKISKTGGIVYEDNQRYDFPINHFSLSGASGSPVLDEQGMLIGVASLANANMLIVRKINYLREFVEGNMGVKCHSPKPVRACLKEEIQNLEDSARKDFVYAQFALALYYQRRFGWDFKEAFHWMEKAAEKGYAPAQYHLALMYYKGEGVDWDLRKAFHWLEKAIEQESVPSQYLLALMYRKDEGTDQDFEKAFYWMKKAAK